MAARLAVAMVIPGLPSLQGAPHSPIARPEAPGPAPDRAKGAEEGALPRRQPLPASTATSGRAERTPPPLVLPGGRAELRLPECATTQNSISQRPQPTCQSSRWAGPGALRSSPRLLDVSGGSSGTPGTLKFV